MATENELAKTAWAAYCEAVQQTSFDGKPLPEWDMLGETQRKGWEAAAAAVENKASEEFFDSVHIQE